MGAPAVTEATLGAWLLKVVPRHAPLDEWHRTGFATVTTRCVRPTYRTRLVREGQPIVLWVSGDDPRHPSGIHAHGEAAGPVRFDDESGLVMPVRLRPTDPVVPRAALVDETELRDLEVLRMPAGSNPSFLDRRAYDVLRRLFPQVGSQEPDRLGLSG